MFFYVLSMHLLVQIVSHKHHIHKVSLLCVFFCMLPSCVPYATKLCATKLCPCKSFVTNITFIRFLSCVYYFMSYKGACTCKSFVTNITFMNVLSSFRSTFYECLENIVYPWGGEKGGGNFCHINNIKERNY